MKLLSGEARKATALATSSGRARPADRHHDGQGRLDGLVILSGRHIQPKSRDLPAAF
ncbi:hypothetical protein ACTMSW_29050 [Micromonospora sp. BQ11]|uniref:hypothetical protein n=1 Tax=Micromonospora sp. BQ11 TaxID=3452212 RepID=UPI003F8B7B98